MTIIDPIEFKDFKSCRPDKLVELVNDLPGSVFIEVFGDWASLYDHSEQEQIITLFNHKLVSISELLVTDIFIGSEIDLSCSGL